MYLNLKAEMARKSITQQNIAKVLKMNVSTLNERLNGKSDFKLKECKKIKEFFFPESTLEYLFEIKKIVN